MLLAYLNKEGKEVDEWDAVVVGAGVGGLSTAVLLAQMGMKTLVVEKDDRVGGRALSMRGEELKEKGPVWYRRLLGGQYCYLVEASPSLQARQREQGQPPWSGRGHFALIRRGRNSSGDWSRWHTVHSFSA